MSLSLRQPRCQKLRLLLTQCIPSLASTQYSSLSDEPYPFYCSSLSAVSTCRDALQSSVHATNDVVFACALHIRTDIALLLVCVSLSHVEELLYTVIGSLQCCALLLDRGLMPVVQEVLVSAEQWAISVPAAALVRVSGVWHLFDILL